MKRVLLAMPDSVNLVYWNMKYLATFTDKQWARNHLPFIEGKPPVVPLRLVLFGPC